MPRLTDLQGQQFGEWEVLEYVGKGKWKCQCSCGEIKNVQTHDLTHGKSTSCGHGTTAFKDLTGQKINEWTVLKRQDGKWLCQCSCGEQRLKSGYELTVENCKSCGHDYNKFKDLTGKRFGEWEVLEHLGDRMWKCRCSCGEIKEIHGYSLTSGASKSCGHTRREEILFKQFGYLKPIEYLGNRLYRCLCKCGKEVIINGNRLHEHTTASCGCREKTSAVQTLITRYGENNTRRLDNPREKWQIISISSKEEFDKLLNSLINKLNRKPTISELVGILDVGRVVIKGKLEKWDLMNKIETTSASDQENRLYQFIKLICDDNGYKVETSNRTLLNGKEIDIYIPELKLGIEYNGSFWHSTSFKSIDYHLNKTRGCAKIGVRLIHIFDYEYSTQKQVNNINLFLKGLVSNSKPSIEADKCEILEESNKIQEYLEKHSIKGYIDSDIHIAISYENKLMSIMTFKKTVTMNKYELTQIEHNPNVKVINGYKVILDYFKNKYKPTYIEYKCDINKFTGKTIQRLGFKPVSLIKPEPKWINTYTLKRSSLKELDIHELLKVNLENEAKTEDEIMEQLRYHKIYDCGEILFVWQKDITQVG